MRVVLVVLAAAALFACDEDATPLDAGADGAVDAALEAAPEDATVDASDASQAEAGTPCGIDSVWTAALPQDLACTGLYTDFANKVVDPSALPYTPGVVLWADGASKSRWLYLPPNSQIDDSNLDEWVFPVGTKVWKEFQLGGHRVETRLFAKGSDTEWLWTTYVWTSDESDATSNDDGETNVVGTYEIPDHGKCASCHGGRNDKLMGVEAIALALPNAQGVTLDWLAKNGKLTVTPPSTSATLPEDATGKAGLALGALHIGCGVSCHNQNPSAGGTSSGFYARLPAAGVLAGTAQVATLDTYATAVNVTPTSGMYATYASQGYKRILPGDATKSLLVAITNERGPGQMPPIVTHVVDATSVQELTDWVNAL